MTKKQRFFVAMTVAVVLFGAILTTILTLDPDNTWTWWQNGLVVVGMFLAVAAAFWLMACVAIWIDNGKDD